MADTEYGRITNRSFQDNHDSFFRSRIQLSSQSESMMCIVVVALQQHPSYPLVIASNRDEFRSRPCRPSAWWEDDSQHPRILAGKDLKESGTWLGITKSGRVACITNYRDMKNRQEHTDAPSRGRLVVQYLAEETPLLDFINQFKDAAVGYNGFNLLLGQWSSSTMDLCWCSNISNPSAVSEPQQLLQQHLEPGIHVISNAHLNTPWPKSEKLRGHLTTITNPPGKGINDTDNGNQSGAVEKLVDSIFQSLQDPEPAKNDDELPDTGIGLEWERLLSSIFVNTPTYGTVSSTVIVVDLHHKVRWEERSYDETGTVSNTAIHEFYLSDST